MKRVYESGALKRRKAEIKKDYVSKLPKVSMFFQKSDVASSGKLKILLI